jgi:putative ABC transport system ATP-binding protein
LDKPILRANNINKTFDKTHFVVKDVTVCIEKGEFTVIMGNSGSGKSTLLFMLSGLDSLSSGTVWINDLPVHGRSEKDLAVLRRNSVGFVFQDNNLIPGLTILENILIAGYLTPRAGKKVLQNAHALLEELDLATLANRYPGEISGGQMQRAAIARAMINNPLILFADEPTGNLNSQSSDIVLKCFAELSKRGQTIVMVTHDLKSACRGSQLLFMKDGSLDGGLILNPSHNALEKEQELRAWLQRKGW